MSDLYGGPERRKNKRLVVNFIVSYKIHAPFRLRALAGSDDIYARMFDICENGMGISTVYDIPTSAVILLKMCLIDLHALRSRDRARSIDIRGETRYNILCEDYEYRVGILFTEIAEQDRLAIANFVKWQSIYNTIPSQIVSIVSTPSP